MIVWFPFSILFWGTIHCTPFYCCHEPSISSSSFIPPFPSLSLSLSRYLYPCLDPLFVLFSRNRTTHAALYVLPVLFFSFVIFYHGFSIFILFCFVFYSSIYLYVNIPLPFFRAVKIAAEHNKGERDNTATTNGETTPGKDDTTNEGTHDTVTVQVPCEGASGTVPVTDTSTTASTSTGDVNSSETASEGKKSVSPDGIDENNNGAVSEPDKIISFKSL